MVAAVLADHRSAPIDPGLRATLDLLQKVTLTPAELQRKQDFPNNVQRTIGESIVLLAWHDNQDGQSE